MLEALQSMFVSAGWALLFGNVIVLGCTAIVEFAFTDHLQKFHRVFTQPFRLKCLDSQQHAKGVKRFMSSRAELRTFNCPRPPHPPAEKIRTVVVDDSSSLLDVLCAVLRLKDNVEVLGIAHDGFEALQIVAKLSPQLVLMDINMPGMDGLEAAALMLPYFPHTRVLLMSSDGSLEVRRQCAQYGADGFIFKGDFAEEFDRQLRELFPKQASFFTA